MDVSLCNILNAKTKEMVSRNSKKLETKRKMYKKKSNGDFFTHEFLEGSVILNPK